MARKWNSVSELAAEMAYRGLNHQQVVLSPETALWLAQQIRGTAPGQNTRADVDMYETGSRVLRVDAEGNVIETVAWAKSTLAARAAFDYVCGYEPDVSFQQRRRAWVEAERIVKRDG